jgi:hypothetical protein
MMRPMEALGRSLQVVGLVIVPMALLYYFARGNRSGAEGASEAQLMFGELFILALGAGVFWLGNYLVKTRS